MLANSNDLLAVARQAASRKGADLVLAVLCGSRAYGTHTDASDWDVRGVFVPPWTALVGMTTCETIEADPDVVLHSLRKFIRLCAQGNPNLLDWLFAPDDCVWNMARCFRETVHARRDLFLSKRLHARFRGYAHSHLQKMGRGVTRELGAKRKLDVEKHGYSCKNAMHLIRLARMGCEVLEGKGYNMRRPDTEELLSIRRGEWDLEKVKREGALLLARMDCALEGSQLPDDPPRAEINTMLVEATLAVRRW